MMHEFVINWSGVLRRILRALPAFQVRVMECTMQRAKTGGVTWKGLLRIPRGLETGGARYHWSGTWTAAGESDGGKRREKAAIIWPLVEIDGKKERGTRSGIKPRKHRTGDL